MRMSTLLDPPFNLGVKDVKKVQLTEIDALTR